MVFASIRKHTHALWHPTFRADLEKYPETLFRGWSNIFIICFPDFSICSAKTFIFGLIAFSTHPPTPRSRRWCPTGFPLCVPDGREFRELRTGEFIQMAGRAGRRGCAACMFSLFHLCASAPSQFNAVNMRPFLLLASIFLFQCFFNSAVFRYIHRLCAFTTAFRHKFAHFACKYSPTDV